jgi:hypothetical protein
MGAGTCAQEPTVDIVPQIGPRKRAFLEQVIDVNVFSFIGFLLLLLFLVFCYCSWFRCAAYCSPPCFYAHSDELV